MKKIILAKVNRIRLILSLILSLVSAQVVSQLLESIPKDNSFSPLPEQVESLDYGIQLFDAYATYLEEPLKRINGHGELFQGKQTDYYAKGSFILHKGIYVDGVLRSYTNFFENQSIERNYKYKADGTGDLEIFFLNGYYRSVQKYANYKAYHWEDYYENGNLAYIETRNKKTGVPELIQENSHNGREISKIEISDNKKLKYIKTVHLPNGTLAEEGELIYIKELEDFRKDGVWITYERGTKTSEVIYQRGTVNEIVMDNRPPGERAILAVNVEPDSTTENPPVEEVVQNTTTLNLKVPESLRLFDEDKNDEITPKEVDRAVNLFFEDDSIELAQINELVNFFFEQE